ncbi:hypothetical protein BHM03_00035373 [Ensete ventricosum]|nr:hypothetical protein BHM03_00035373 [Ensete ventricosum]
MDLNVLCKKPRMPSRRALQQLDLRVHSRGGSNPRADFGKEAHREFSSRSEPKVSAEDLSPTFHRSKSMKDLCGIWVHKDDEGYYVLHIVDWAPRDPSAAIQARWPNLSYLAKVWDDPEAAMEFGWGVLHSTLAKDLYTLPSEVLIARATKQIALGHHYQMALLDRVHDLGRLVTHMGNRASLLEAEIEN